jgi:hypothetical protein
MGTTYYLARPDNRTLFDMDKAYGLSKLIDCGTTHAVDLGALEAALLNWFSEWPSEDENHAKEVARRVAVWVADFAEGQHVYFISEHHEWIDGDQFRDNGWLRVVSDRFDGPETKCLLRRFWVEKTGGSL